MNDVGWNLATGVVATGLQMPIEKVMGKSVGTVVGEAGEGISKGVAPIAADTSAQWTSHTIQHTLPVITKKTRITGSILPTPTVPNDKHTVILVLFPTATANMP